MVPAQHTHLVRVREAEVEPASLVPLSTYAEASTHAKARHGDGDASLRLIALRHRHGGVGVTHARK